MQHHKSTITLTKFPVYMHNTSFFKLARKYLHHLVDVESTDDTHSLLSEIYLHVILFDNWTDEPL